MKGCCITGQSLKGKAMLSGRISAAGPESAAEASPSLPSRTGLSRAASPHQGLAPGQPGHRDGAGGRRSSAGASEEPSARYGVGERQRCVNE